jgi:hypothetical protein
MGCLLLLIIFLLFGYLTAVVGVFVYVFLPIAAIALVIKVCELITSNKTSSEGRVTPRETRPTRSLSATKRASIESEIREKERKIRDGEW